MSMKTILKRIGFGIILWAVGYFLAIPLLPLMQTDPQAFKALVTAIMAVVTSVLAVFYFLDVRGDYFKESLKLAATWVLVSWIMDVVALLPFSHQTLPQYFLQIGVEYIGMMAPFIALGYLLEKKIGGATPSR